MKAITIYSLENCPYCVKAKSLLQAKGLEFNEVKIDPNSSNQVQELVQKTGMRTFPQIFFGEQLVGGYSELEELDRNGKVEELLADKEQPKKVSGCCCH